MITNCIECGKEFDFIPTSNKSLALCSDVCRTKRRRRKQAEWGKNNYHNKNNTAINSHIVSPKNAEKHIDVNELLFEVNKSMCNQGVIVFDIPNVEEREASYIIKGTDRFFYEDSPLTGTCLLDNTIMAIDDIKYPIKYCYVCERQAANKLFLSNIQASCKKNKITQTQLSEMLSMSSSTFNNTINLCYLNMGFIENLEKCLNVKIEFKFLGKEDINIREVITRLTGDKLQLDFMEDFADIIGAKFYYEFKTLKNF